MFEVIDSENLQFGIQRSGSRLRVSIQSDKSICNWQPVARSRGSSHNYLMDNRRGAWRGKGGNFSHIRHLIRTVGISNLGDYSGRWSWAEKWKYWNRLWQNKLANLNLIAQLLHHKTRASTLLNYIILFMYELMHSIWRNKKMKRRKINRESKDKKSSTQAWFEQTLPKEQDNPRRLVQIQSF